VLQFRAICADIKAVTTTNLKGSAKEEDESSPHLPDSPDLASYDCHIFGPLKNAI